MNNPGWSRLFDTPVQSAIERGAQYMVLEKSLLDTEEFVQFKEKIIGEHEGLMIIKF